MAQSLTAVPIPEAAEPGKESYEIIWDIADWREVRKSENLVNRQVAVFETTSSSGWFKTKWIVGLTIAPFYKAVKYLQLYWKLLEITGSQEKKLEAKLQTQLWNCTTSVPEYTDLKNQEIHLMEIVEAENVRLKFSLDGPSYNANIIGHYGKMTYKLKLTLATPNMSLMEQFFKNSVGQAIQNHATLVNNSENADLKFLTSDEIEIWAHKVILKAQCPVFAAMLNSNFSEKSTGIIRMTDITGKTLKILLHYFYTGELLPSWSDSDTIVVFTYAAGKYQMTKVLELLDVVLGRDSVDEASNLDVKLIDLAGKLKLDNAEAKLLERIVAKIEMVASGKELFELFGYEEQELLEVAEMLETVATDKNGASWILATMDDLCAFGSNESESSLENGMAMLAHVQNTKLKRLEEILLKCFAEKAKLVQNAEELFDLFGRGNQMMSLEDIDRASTDHSDD